MISISAFKLVVSRLTRFSPLAHYHSSYAARDGYRKSDHRSNRKEKNRCATAHNTRNNTYTTRHIPLVRQAARRRCRAEPSLRIAGSRQRKPTTQHFDLIPSNGFFRKSNSARLRHPGQTPTSVGPPCPRVRVRDFHWFGPAGARGVKVTFQLPGTGAPASAQVRSGVPQHTNKFSDHHRSAVVH